MFSAATLRSKLPPIYVTIASGDLKDCLCDWRAATLLHTVHSVYVECDNFLKTANPTISVVASIDGVLPSRIIARVMSKLFI